ncbi:hypothetical protein ACFC5Z_13055 [Streptomyces sp. NPDC056004]|uniref:hypothetical protein n=1 Tax=Streptomyces sp. NPDC056004 TaxID=3345677 RepID=UPI0035DC21EB
MSGPPQSSSSWSATELPQRLDELVVTDDTQGRTLITSRKPGCLEPFLREVDSALAANTE